MRCVIHIGTEKTGSTFLQGWLYDNQKALSKQGVFLSNVLGKPNNRVFSSYFQRNLDDFTKRLEISSQQEKASYFTDFEHMLSNEIISASVRHKVFVISSEQLHSRLTRREDVERVHQFLSGRFSHVSVVGYFRKQPDMALSLYSTAMKVGVSYQLDEFLEKEVEPNNYYYNFKSIADNWSSVFGKQACNFRLYDRQKFELADIRLDFIAQIGCPVKISRLSFRASTSNESLSQLMAAVFRNINTHVPYFNESDGGVSELNTQLKKAVSSLSCLADGKLSSTLRSEIEHRFESSNRQFIAEYVANNQGFTVPDTSPEPEMSFTLGEVEEIVANVSNTLLQFVSDDWFPRLYDADAVYLRDTAVKVERGQVLTLDDSLKLMTLAKRVRPSGPFIEKKVDEYTRQLSSP